MVERKADSHTDDDGNVVGRMLAHLCHSERILGVGGIEAGAIFQPDSNIDNGAEANHVYGTIYWKCIINDVANRVCERRRRRRCRVRVSDDDLVAVPPSNA